MVTSRRGGGVVSHLFNFRAVHQPAPRSYARAAPKQYSGGGTEGRRHRSSLGWWYRHCGRGDILWPGPSMSRLAGGICGNSRPGDR